MFQIREDGKLHFEEFPSIAAADEIARELHLLGDKVVEVVEVRQVRRYPRLLTEDQRGLLLDNIDIREWANNNLVGDGLEIDTVLFQFSGFTDEELVLEGILNGAVELWGQDEGSDPDEWKLEVRRVFTLALPGDSAIAEKVIKKIEVESL